MGAFADLMQKKKKNLSLRMHFSYCLEKSASKEQIGFLPDSKMSMLCIGL